MDSRYSYDDNQQVWPFFAVTLLGCVLVPTSLSSLSGLLSRKPATARPGYSAKLAAYDARRKSHRRAILLALGWILMAVLVQVIRNIEPAEGEAAAFDPYQLLDVGRSATEKEIKSAYRKLTVKFHPDKIRDLGELTLQEVEDRYVTLTKAYKALTDEETRENFLKYGHPDGPQTQVMGIALPKFLIEGGTPLLFAVYALIGIGAPLLAARWWSQLASRNSQNILQSSATAFFLMCSQEQLMFLSVRDILERVAECSDYQDGKDAAWHLAELRAQLEGGSGDPHTVATAVRLLQGLHSIAFEFKVFEFCRRVVELQRCLVQGVDPAKSGRVAKEARAAGKAPVSLHVLQAEFKVPGMSVVAPGSLPHLVVRYLVVPQGATKMPTISPEILAAEDEVEANVRTLRDPLSTNKLAPKLAPSQSTKFPASEQFVPKWNAYIYGDLDRILSQPVALEHLDMSNARLTPEQFASGDGVVVSTFKIMFGGPLPQQLAKIPLKLALLNVGEFGCDVRMRVQVETKQPVQEQVDTVSDDESEPEEEEEQSDLSDIDTDTDEE